MTKEQKLERINQISEAILELKLTGDAVKTKLTTILTGFWNGGFFFNSCKKTYKGGNSILIIIGPSTFGIHIGVWFIPPCCICEAIVIYYKDFILIKKAIATL